MRKDGGYFWHTAEVPVNWIPYIYRQYTKEE